MNARTVLLLVFVAGVAAFTAANWSLFTAPAALSLIVVSVYAPLGLVMLGLTGVSILIALAFAAQLKTTMLIESREHAREMQAQRKLADAAEASRLTQVQRALEAAVEQNAHYIAESRTDLNNRVALMELNLRTSIEASGNTLAAYIGELEDRLEKRPAITGRPVE